MGEKRREALSGVGGCLLIAAVLLLLCSQCSPLYPTNIWGDANCLMTVGRVMRSGGVIYRDIYEQKGPTLYLIHAVAAAVSDTSFLGVFLMEILSLGAALYFAFRILRGRLCVPGSLACAALLGAGMLVCTAFVKGDSAEEFCLPYLMGSLCLVLEQIREDGTLKPWALFACGLAAGMVATIKYSVLGLFVGLCAAEGIAALRCGGMKRAICSAGVFLAGMLTPILLWVVYFAAHGALGDFYTAYIYNNIMLYEAEGEAASDLMEAVKGVLRYVRDNALWAVPAALGVVHYVLFSGETGWRRLSVLLMGLCSLTAVCFLGRFWVYCPLALSVFAVLGLRALLEGFAAFMNVRGLLWYRRVFPPAAMAAAVLAAALLSPNAFLRGESLENMAQGRLAKFIHPGATLLQYGHLDDGLYLAADRLPKLKYFVRLNVGLDEMHEEIERYVAEGIPDYVLVTWKELPAEHDHYQLIATDAGYDESNRINKMFYLYRRR